MLVAVPTPPVVSTGVPIRNGTTAGVPLAGADVLLGTDGDVAVGLALPAGTEVFGGVTYGCDGCELFDPDGVPGCRHTPFVV